MENQIIAYDKNYMEFKEELKTELNKTVESFVRIGYLLKVARDTNILRDTGYENVVDFARVEFNIDKTQVSRFISINDRFAEDGYSDCLAENYRGFGYAKLCIMLQLPESINEEITPEYSKAEIQAIKEEVDAEKEVSDIEVLLEGKDDHIADQDTDIEKSVKQLGADAPELFAELYQAIWQQSCTMDKLQTTMAPSGLKIYSVRIRGVGRKQLILKDKDNGDEVVLIDLRSGEKTKHTWEELGEAWEDLIRQGTGEDCKTDWQQIYMNEWPIKEEVVPVQQPKEDKKPAHRKESKVQKAPKKPESRIEKGTDGTLESTVDGPEIEPQLPGQTSIEQDFPEYMPDNTQKEAEEESEELPETRIEKGSDGNLASDENETVQMTKYEAHNRRKTYMHMLKTSTEDVIRYAEMQCYNAAKMQVHEMEKLLEEMERLPVSMDEEELNGEEVEASEAQGV